MLAAWVMSVALTVIGTLASLADDVPAGLIAGGAGVAGLAMIAQQLRAIRSEESQRAQVAAEWRAVVDDQREEIADLKKENQELRTTLRVQMIQPKERP